MDSLSLLFRVIFTNNTPIGILLVCAISLMGLAGGLMAHFHYRRYCGAETNYLNLVKAKLHAFRDQIVNSSNTRELGSPPPLPALFLATELASGVPPESIIGDRLHTIALLRQSQTKVSLSALQQISRAKESARTSLRFPGMAANLAMMMGLLGTFIGIAIVIQQIGLNIDQGDGSLTGFSKAFSGMYTKFSTTLVGTTCSIVLSVLNFRLAQAQERLFESLDRFTVSELLPATMPAMEEETLLEQIMVRLDQSFARIEEIAADNARTADKVGALQAGFSDIIANIRQQTRIEGPDRLQNLLGHVAGVMEQMSVINSSLQAIPAAMAETNRSLEKSLSRAEFERPRNDPMPTAEMPYAKVLISLGAGMLVLLAVIAFK